MGSESSVPNLFDGQTGSETAGGKILGNNLGHFGSGFDEPVASNDPLAYGDPFSQYQNQIDSGFGHQEGKNMATVRDFGHFGSVLGASEVDCCHYLSGTAVTMPPYLSAGAGICGSGGDRSKSADQSGTGIFTTAFADQWTTDIDDPEPEGASPCTDNINHIIKICGFSTNSLIV
jgi:hypothetical protein